MGLFDSLFRSAEILGIAEEALEFALESCEDAHPNEYMALLRGTEADRLGLDESGLVITDLLVIPGTESNSVSATLKTNMVPNERNAVGSLHSHPNGVLRPSTADLQTFGRNDVHIIAGAPYRRTDWQAFDSQGEPTSLDVLDVELPDAEEFFHFDQADLDREAGISDGGEDGDEPGWRSEQDRDRDGWGRDRGHERDRDRGQGDQQ